MARSPNRHEELHVRVQHHGDGRVRHQIHDRHRDRARDCGRRRALHHTLRDDQDGVRNHADVREDVPELPYVLRHLRGRGVDGGGGARPVSRDDPMTPDMAGR